MKSFKCKCGKDILVDDSDFNSISQMRWYCHKSAIQDERQVNIACYILQNVPFDREPDHKDGDFHNNQKYNLRVATRSQNRANKVKQKNNTSGFIGVHLELRTGKYFARIQVASKTYHLGTFTTAEEAARRRDRAATHYFGEFAKLNFPNETNSDIQS